MALNTAGLNEAYLRKLKGTANATDLANLAYAQSKGWSYQAPQPQTQPTDLPPIPAGYQPISGALYNTRALQQANYSNIQQIGNTLYGIPKVATKLTSDQLTSSTPSVPVVSTSSRTSPQGIVAGANTYMDELMRNLSAENARRQELENRLMTSQTTANELLAQIGGKGQEYRTELEKYNYTANINQLQEINRQIAEANAKFEKMITENQGRPVLSTMIGGQESLIRRQQASEIGSLSALAQALQGNITLAQNTAKDAIDVKYEPLENQLQQQLQQINFIYNDLSRADQQRADAQKLLLEERARQLEEDKTTENNILNIALTAAQNGADINTLNAIRTAKTLDEAILRASGAEPILTPAGLAGLTEDQIIRVGSRIYKKGTNYLAPQAQFQIGDFVPQKIGTDVNGNDLFYDPQTNSIKTAEQLSTAANVGNQVGTIMGLPSYDTKSANPGLSRPDRNNNPGNIKVSTSTKDWEGVIGVESTPAEDGGHFLIFDNAQSGINAIGKLLLTKGYVNMTAEQAIKKYNGNGSYGAADVGLNPNQDLQSQIKDPTKRAAVAAAIARAEGFRGAIPVSQITPTVQSIEELDPLIRNYATQIVEGTQKMSDIKGTTAQETARLQQAVTNAIPLVQAQKRQEANNTATMALNLIDELRNSKALKAATGLSYWRTKIPGTASYAFARTFNQLTDLLAMENLNKLKGTMSDKDIEFLRNSATKLSLKLPTSAFLTELNELEKRIKNATIQPPATGVTSSGITYEIEE